MSYSFSSDISENKRVSELHANLTKGNHKSAKENQQEFNDYLKQDVRYGFAVPVLCELVHKIPNALVQPGGLASQYTLTPDGSRVPQKRLTHDLTYEQTGTNISVNNRIDLKQYTPMFYGHCLLRIIHFIVAL